MITDFIDYIGNVEECVLVNIEVLENINKVFNDISRPIKLRTNSDDKFILE